MIKLDIVKEKCAFMLSEKMSCFECSDDSCSSLSGAKCNVGSCGDFINLTLLERQGGGQIYLLALQESS